MSTSDQHLVQMANDIAANLWPGKAEQEAAEATAGHIRKFWAPPMRKKIVELWRDNDAAISENAGKAIALMTD
jgi:hypothetical protein